MAESSLVETARAWFQRAVEKQLANERAKSEQDTANIKAAIEAGRRAGYPFTPNEVAEVMADLMKADRKAVNADLKRWGFLPRKMEPVYFDIGADSDEELTEEESMEEPPEDVHHEGEDAEAKVSAETKTDVKVQSAVATIESNRSRQKSLNWRLFKLTRQNQAAITTLGWAGPNHSRIRLPRPPTHSRFPVYRRCSLAPLCQRTRSRH